MKTGIKAALWSALVFPGLGHCLVLKRVARGSLFLLPAALALSYLLRHVLGLVATLADQVASGALALDPAVIAQRVAESGLYGPGNVLALLACVLCWAGSIADSFLAAQAPPQ